MISGLGTAIAIDYNVPENASVVTSRFWLYDMDAADADFSMLSEDGSLIIHINEDTIIYFEDFIMVRDVLEEGQTLAEVLDSRNLVVTSVYTLDSYPQQAWPISIKVLYEEIMPLTGGLVFDELPFKDVDPNDWFYNSVVWAYNNGIMNGVSDTEFAPNANMTRAMLVTVLWRYAGQPEAGESTFDDVESGTWYSEAVAWAAENGIVTGHNETTFGPRGQINREQMYTILYRYMNFAGLTIELEDEMRLPQFADEDEISDWAKDALHFMFDAGVMFREHDFDNYARPQEYAPRGEIAGAMYFFDMLAISSESEEEQTTN